MFNGGTSDVTITDILVNGIPFTLPAGENTTISMMFAPSGLAYGVSYEFAIISGETAKGNEFLKVMFNP